MSWVLYLRGLLFAGSYFCDAVLPIGLRSSTVYEWSCRISVLILNMPILLIPMTKACYMWLSYVRMGRSPDYTIKYFKSETLICQRATAAFDFIVYQFGFPVLKYLDDFADAEKGNNAKWIIRLLRSLLEKIVTEEALDKACSPT